MLLNMMKETELVCVDVCLVVECYLGFKVFKKEPMDALAAIHRTIIERHPQGDDCEKTRRLFLSCSGMLLKYLRDC